MAGRPSACTLAMSVLGSARHQRRGVRYDERCGEVCACVPEAALAGVHRLPSNAVARATGCGLRRLHGDCPETHTVAGAGERVLRCRRVQRWSARASIRGLHGELGHG